MRSNGSHPATNLAGTEGGSGNWGREPGSRQRTSRRSHQPRKRDQAETIVNRARWLPERDRRVVLAVYRDGQPIGEVARLLNIPPSTLRSRLKRATSHLFDPAVCLVATESVHWNDSMRRVGRSCFLERRSVRDAAERLDLSYHTVRKHREAIIALAASNARRERTR